MTSRGPELVSHFLRFLQAGYRSSCLHGSSLDSGPSYRILNLANVVDIFVANSTSQIVVTVMHLEVFTKEETLLYRLHLLIGPWSCILSSVFVLQ